MKKGGSIAARLRRLYARHGDRIVMIALVGCLLTVVVGSIVPGVGDWLEKIRFIGPGLLLAVALILYEAIVRDRTAFDDAQELVVARPQALLPFLHRAAERRRLSVTFVGYSSETLYNLLSELFLEAGPNRWESVEIRVLIPDCTRPIGMPAHKHTLEDHVARREQSQARATDQWQRIRWEVERLERENISERVLLEVRAHRLTPLLKLYLLNDDAVFWGPYPIEEYPFTEVGGQVTSTLDFDGIRSPLIGAIASHGARDQEIIRVMSTWAERLWSLAARPVLEFATD